MVNMRWRFPSTGGGVIYNRDPSSSHFKEAPVPNFVREVIQNSLDAKYEAIGEPVRVIFSETSIKKSLIGGTELEGHLHACLDYARERSDTGTAETYEKAIQAIDHAEVRCLKVQDTGTTGLKDNLWDSLVREEGAVSKFGDNPGGNYGIGKNAVLNVSDLRTVFYSTRYIGRDAGTKGRVRGRIDKLQGKATLMTHPDPSDPADMVQHIGFYADEAGHPLVGARNIPKAFRLDDTGTGVFVLGFNPRSDDWVFEVARAAAENFFYAIHNKDLVVSVKPADGQEGIEIVHDTLEDLLENCDAKYYYRAIRDSKPRQTTTMNNMGALDAYVRFEKNAPRRVGYINRNGMLITDSREQKSNPLAPRGNSFWPDYAVMVMPTTAEGDMWVRQMENPSHTALSAEHLPDEKGIRAAKRSFRDARKELGRIIHEESGLDTPSDKSNIGELAHLFPLEGEEPGQDELLKVRNIERRRPSTRLADPDGPEDEGDAGDDYEGTSADNGSDDTDDDDTDDDETEDISNSNGETKGNTGTQPRPSRYVLNNVRMIPHSRTECFIAFTPESEDGTEIALPLSPAGADAHPGKDPNRSRKVDVLYAEAANDTDAEIFIKDGEIRVRPHSTGRVVIKVEASASLDGYAFSLAR